MRKLALLLALTSCTGLNLDEDHLDTHGAALASVNCLTTSLSYSAVMFLDGSVWAAATMTTGAGSAFYERGDSARVEAMVPLGPKDDCDGPRSSLKIESGDLNRYSCQGSPSAQTLVASVDIDTCAGFNKSLFD